MSPLRVSAERVALLRDSVRLRDARAQGPRPSLVRGGRSDPSWDAPHRRAALLDGDLEVRGPFTVLQRFSISADEGRLFVETSRDSNPIHTEDRVVPGAMTAARHLLLPEILLPGTAVSSLKTKFRAFAYYDRPTFNVVQFRPAGRVDGTTGDGKEARGDIAVTVRSYQAGQLVAESSLRANRLSTTHPRRASSDALPHAEAEEARSARRSLSPRGESEECIQRFLWSLGVDPDGFLQHLGYGYPRAFLASLPSGEMVRLGGEGGILNVLDFKFPDAAIPAIGSAPPPVAEVEPKSPRRSFRKVLTRVCSGIRTYCEGYATVLSAILHGPELSGREA